MDVKIDDSDMEDLYRAMLAIFTMLPDEKKDQFIGLIMESHELYTLDQACEALAESKQR